MFCRTFESLLPKTQIDRLTKNFGLDRIFALRSSQVPEKQHIPPFFRSRAESWFRPFTIQMAPPEHPKAVSDMDQTFFRVSLSFLLSTQEMDAMLSFFGSVGPARHPSPSGLTRRSSSTFGPPSPTTALLGSIFAALLPCPKGVSSRAHYASHEHSLWPGNPRGYLHFSRCALPLSPSTLLAQRCNPAFKYGRPGPKASSLPFTAHRAQLMGREEKPISIHPVQPTARMAIPIFHTPGFTYGPRGKTYIHTPCDLQAKFRHTPHDPGCHLWPEWTNWIHSDWGA